MINIPENQFTKPYIESHKQLFARALSTAVTMDGWATTEKVATLISLVLAAKPQIVVEIGVWAGRSLLPMAVAVAENKVGRVIGIDPYNADDSVKDEFPDVADWWGKQDHESIFRKFNHWNTYFKTESVVTLIRKKSDDVKPPSGIGVLHIDGSHTEQAIKDVERYAPNVVSGGYVITDDIHWVGGGVLRAMDKLEEMGFKKVFELTNGTGDDWAVFQKQK